MARSRRYGPRDVYERPGAVYNDIVRYYQPTGVSVISRVASARARLREARAELQQCRDVIWEERHGGLQQLQSERAYNAVKIRALLAVIRDLTEYIRLERAGSLQRMRAELQQ